MVMENDSSEWTRYPNDERTHEFANALNLLYEAQWRGRDGDCPWCYGNFHYEECRRRGHEDYCPLKGMFKFKSGTGL